MSNINDIANLLSAAASVHPVLFRFLICACVATFLIALLTDVLKQNSRGKTKPSSDPRES